MQGINFEAIDAAPLQQDPFDFLVVPGCLDASALATINQDYPTIEQPGNLSVDAVSFGPSFQSVLDQLQGPELAKHIGRKFSVDLMDCPVTTTVRKFCEPSDGNIHTDHPSKIITVLMYFNEHWSENSGQLRMLRSATDIEDFAAEVPPQGGTLLAFRRTDISYHGHKRFVGERRMVQMNYLRATRLAQWKQQLDRLGTRAMKKAARVFGN
ncbi:MAG: 2OG-Fe(II) oxygenase [Gammaproteobacteria bacterium]